MTRTPDYNTEKLNQLFTESEWLERKIAFLKNKIKLLVDSETLAEHAPKEGAKLYVAQICYKAVQDDIKRLQDLDV